MNAGARQHGFSFVEIMVAVALLAICAVPMADALRNGVNASSIAAAKARELRCIKNTMELLLAEPYQSLYAAARGKDERAVFIMPESFSLPVDASCNAAPEVYIAKYELENGGTELFLPADATMAQRESPLLYITVTAANGGEANAGYSFTTLVAR